MDSLGQQKGLLPLQHGFLPCLPSNSERGKSSPTGRPGSHQGLRNSYLTVQIDADQTDVAIEIDVLCDGSIVRRGDQESL